MPLVLLAACVSRSVSAPAPEVALAEPPDPPRAVQAARDVPLKGFWRSQCTTFSWSVLEVRAGEQGELVLVSYYSGCTDLSASVGVGRRADGCLVCDDNWLGFGVHRLVPMRVDGVELLVPEGRAGGRGLDELTAGIGGAYRRLLPVETAEFPDRWHAMVEGRRQGLEDIRREIDERVRKDAAAHPAGDARR